MLEPTSVEAGFVHADKTDGREVVLEGAKIVLGVRIEAAIEERGDGLAFDIERTGRDIHQVIETGIEVVFVGR
jgi:hypothetical protein